MKLGIVKKENRNSHIPNSVTENEDIKMLRSQGVQTCRQVLANRPVIQKEA
jgi:hypothetical protein